MTPATAQDPIAGIPPARLAAFAAREAARFAASRPKALVARAVTGRPKVLVFNGCYHGTVDETMVALIGNAGTLTRLAERLTLQADMGDIQLRVLLVLVFLANALLKFIWSNRLFGYCSIIMASVPNDPMDPLAPHRAGQATEINITAAKSFNRGLRSIYFALAAMGWLVGAYGLIAATVVSTLVLARREFASQSREVMLQRDVA